MALDVASFIERVEAADADEFAEILRRPTLEEDRALRAYLGDRRYQYQRDLTLRRSIVRSAARELSGNVVVIHGIMGSELSAFSRAGKADQIWVKVMKIVVGALGRLQLADDGLKEVDESFDVRPTGMLKRHYGDLLLSLSGSWRVRAFWFDWRKSLDVAAAELDAKLTGWFGEEPVHIVAHSMGGLVARTFICRYRAHWERLRGDDSGRSGGRLVMLGTPNHGSFAIPQVLTGIEGTVKKLTLVDARNTAAQLRAVLNSFPGTYQMLPSPLLRGGRWQALYDPTTYPGLHVSRPHLDAARAHHELLSEVVDPERLVYVAGANQRTLVNVDPDRTANPKAYTVSREGDGRVPHELGLLSGVRTFYVETSHGDLTTSSVVLSRLDDLLRTGECDLATAPPTPRALADGRSDARALEEEQQSEQEEVRDRAAALGFRAASGQASPTTAVSTDRELEELLVRGLLSTQDSRRRPPARPRRVRRQSIRLSLVPGAIEEMGKEADETPIDAVAVGHYVGVRPQQAELALDRSISAGLTPGRNGRQPARLLITEYSERGIIRGELGQPFFLEDPRQTATTGGPRRVVVLAGMGLPGRFGAPELTVLARELVWALGRLGKRHLATVLIGAGTGNIPIPDAVEAWLRGLSDALTSAVESAGGRLEQLTFVEASAAKLDPLQDAIVAQKSLLEKCGLGVEYEPLSAERLVALEQEELKQLQRRLTRQDLRSGREPGRPAPTRLTLSLDHGVYTVGAITQTASLPERAIPLDPTLVEQANDELAGEWQPNLQCDRGRLLERLLIPDDLRPMLAGNAPVVMLLDATVARIHWEMLAQSDPGVGRIEGDTQQQDDLERVFLGTSRGFTRQLRTTFAPPPEPPPPPRRVLRVLVVADPAADARLDGAEEEGVAVADLFESFNAIVPPTVESRIEVIRLLGPNAATRTAVMRHLAVHSYDVLHYAGHCVYDEDDPARQGWLFTGGKLLSPNELSRIDRIPKFVFSNACESGVTPDRANQRAPGLAPSFAESFFARGVSNFVCTAWPVSDRAARDFALTLYARLLGIPVTSRLGASRPVSSWVPEEMHRAMREARLAIFNTLDGRQTWGAYQHYGNPYFRLFEPAAGKPHEPVNAAVAKPRGPRAGRVLPAKAIARSSPADARPARLPGVS